MNFEDFESSAFSPERSYPEISGFDEHSELSDNDVEAVIQLLPSSHIEHCPSISCLPESPLWKDYPDASGLYNTATSEIFLSGAEGVSEAGTTELEILLHEIGHNAYDSILGENPQLIADWAELYDASMIKFAQTGFGFVSNYSHTDMFEDFAESYAEYVANPQLMQFLCPDKYNFMQENVFNGREYDSVQAPDGSYILSFKDVTDVINNADSNAYAEGLDGVHSWENFGSIADSFRCFTIIAG